MVLLLEFDWLVSPIGAVSAQETHSGSAGQSAELAEADQLVREATKLFSEGKYEAALPVVERALAINEQMLGPEHPQVPSPLTCWRCCIGPQATLTAPSPSSSGF